MRVRLFDGDPGVDALPGMNVEYCPEWRLFRSSMPAVYVAFDPEHLQRYEAWFPGVAVRVNARLRDRPLPPGAALFLPVTYNSWMVVIEGPDAFPAALEAARWLKDVQGLACPQLPAPPPPPAPAYRRWRDLVIPVDDQES